jgi:AcrR family transcriptional regulator
VRKKSAGKRALKEIDGRVEKSKQTVLATTFELLAKLGLSGVSVDEISRRSGVAKTTIYRHWPSRETLLMEACSQFKSSLSVPNTGSLKGDLEALAGEVVARLQHSSSTVMPSIIDVAERNEELAALQAEIHAQTRGPLVTVIERAQQRRELAHSQDPREVVACILGPLLYRRFFSREPLDQAFAKRIVVRALGKSK